MSDPSISILPNGPLKVETGTRVIDADGNPIDTPEGKAFFLCRCGQSSNKPFCDGTHNRFVFDGSLAPGN